MRRQQRRAVQIRTASKAHNSNHRTQRTSQNHRNLQIRSAKKVAKRLSKTGKKASRSVSPVRRKLQKGLNKSRQMCANKMRLHKCKTASLPPKVNGNSACLDLHYLNRKEAEQATKQFLEQAYHSDKEQVTIITGKGNHSKGSPVLKKYFPQWLKKTENELGIKHRKPRHPLNNSGAYVVQFGTSK